LGHCTRQVEQAGEGNMRPQRWRLDAAYPRAIYRQLGHTPSGKDTFLGLMATPEVAELIVMVMNEFFDGSYGLNQWESEGGR